MFGLPLILVFCSLLYELLVCWWCFTLFWFVCTYLLCWLLLLFCLGLCYNLSGFGLLVFLWLFVCADSDFCYFGLCVLFVFVFVWLIALCFGLYAGFVLLCFVCFLVDFCFWLSSVCVVIVIDAIVLLMLLFLFCCLVGFICFIRWVAFVYLICFFSYLVLDFVCVLCVTEFIDILVWISLCL